MNNSNLVSNLFFRVISLDSEVARRASVKAQIENLGINFEFFDAVDLRGKTSKEVQSYAEKSEGSIGRRLTNGEIGCAVSHIKCYEEFLTTDCDVGVFLEDDADLSRLNGSLLTMISECICAGDADVIILGYSKVAPTDESFIERVEPIKVKKIFGNVRLGVVWRNWTCGTVAYAMSRNGAKKILNDYYHKNNSRISTVADDWNFFNTLGLVILHVRPLLVLEKFSLFESSIEPDRKKILKQRIEMLDVIRIARGHIRKLLLWLTDR